MARCQTFLLLVALAIPVRRPIVSEWPPPVPIFSGQWGPYTMYQLGNIVVVDSASWHATGVIGADGVIAMYWVQYDGTLALGTYHLADLNKLVGKWHYAGSSTLHCDTMWRTK